MNNAFMGKERTSAVVIGLSTNGLGNVRALARNGIPVIIFLSEAESREEYAATRYGQKRIVPVTDGPSILEHLRGLPGGTRHIIYPTTDYQVKYLSQNREKLPPNCVLQFPDDKVVQTLLDKELFDQFCRDHAYPVPETQLVRNEADISRVCRNMPFPVIVKTATKIYKKGLEKAYIISDGNELAEWYKSIQDIHREFVLQRYIPGTDLSVYFTMQYISAKGELLASFTGRKIRQWPPLKGGTSSAEPAYNEFLTDMTRDFFRKAGFWGIGSMEYKLDSRDGKYYMIEPTVCRTDFQEGVAIANGINIPLVAYKAMTEQVVQPVFQKKTDKKAWMHTLYDRLSKDWYLDQKKITYFEWLASLRNVRSFDAFSARDPGPLLKSFLEKVNNRFRRLLNRK